MGHSPFLAAGTRLLTPSGWQPIETLSAGDTLVTADGEHRVLSRTACRDVTGRHLPEILTPLRICAGAFAPDLPRCDVVLSPDQTVFIERMLIPAGLLANGATVRREPGAAPCRFQISLPAQDVIVADGLPVGSHQAARPRAPRSPADQCGDVLRRSRAHLLARANALDYRVTQDADLHLLANGRRIWGRLANGIWSGWVPKDVRDLRIVSRASAPADCLADSDDQRRLGVALRGISLQAGHRRRDLALDGPGWGDGVYPVESDGATRWRWTNGDAALPPSLWQGLDADFRLDLRVLRSQTYRLAPPGNLATLLEKSWRDD